jgi:hypothetical protein
VPLKLAQEAFRGGAAGALDLDKTPWRTFGANQPIGRLGAAEFPVQVDCVQPRSGHHLSNRADELRASAIEQPISHRLSARLRLTQRLLKARSRLGVARVQPVQTAASFISGPLVWSRIRARAVAGR